MQYCTIKVKLNNAINDNTQKLLNMFSRIGFVKNMISNSERPPYTGLSWQLLSYHNDKQNLLNY